MVEPLPTGFRESVVGGARLVAQDTVHDELRAALASTTLHAWAGARAGARALQGRGVAWAVTTATGDAVVVRHARHGGLLARLTGDVFLAPARAPAELAASLRLRAAGVPTPHVLGFATYAAFGPFCRADVVTALVDGRDFPEAWASTPRDARPGLLAAVGTLLRRLEDAHAAHADLNAKNILIDRSAARAWVLDVDRVSFPRHAGAAAANLGRLARSLAKLRRVRDLDFGPDDWRGIAAAAGRPDTGLDRFG